MKYESTAQMAKKWGLAERTVRNYCATGKIPGAVLSAKTWKVPENATRPERVNKKNQGNQLLAILQEEKRKHLSGGIYQKVQIELTYNSNHMEGSKLTHDQTRYIYETNTIGIENQVVNVDDIVETVNHFRCIDMVIESANCKITEKLIKDLHFQLKNATSDSQRDWFRVGEYKMLPNEVGGRETTLSENVEKELSILLKQYNGRSNQTLEDILDFHVKFERIHPFQDGNGRVGRLLIFKECLRNGITPFIIEDDIKLFYYRGLDQWDYEKGYLTDTCLTAQDRFKNYLKYFRIGIDCVK